MRRIGPVEIHVEHNLGAEELQHEQAVEGSRPMESAALLNRLDKQADVHPSVIVFITEQICEMIRYPIFHF